MELIALTLFVVLSIVGYKKDNRNLLLSGAVILLIGFGGHNFIAGFIDGYNSYN